MTLAYAPALTQVHSKDMGMGDLQFVNLQRSDYKELFRFLNSKKLRIKNIAAGNLERGGGDDDSDEDDPYMARVRAERRAPVDGSAVADALGPAPPF